MSARTNSTVPSGLTKSIDKGSEPSSRPVPVHMGTMGWAENALKENLVTFTKAFNFAPKRVRYFDYLNSLFLKRTQISFASASAPLSFLFQWPEVSLVRLQESPIQALIDDSSNLIAEDPADVLSGIVIPT
jgi:hypothetical protein